MNITFSFSICVPDVGRALSIHSFIHINTILNTIYFTSWMEQVIYCRLLFILNFLRAVDKKVLQGFLREFKQTQLPFFVAHDKISENNYAKMDKNSNLIPFHNIRYLEFLQQMFLTAGLICFFINYLQNKMKNYFVRTGCLE